MINDFGVDSFESMDITQGKCYCFVNDNILSKEESDLYDGR